MPRNIVEMKNAKIRCPHLSRASSTCLFAVTERSNVLIVGAFNLRELNSSWAAAIASSVYSLNARK